VCTTIGHEASPFAEVSKRYHLGIYANTGNEAEPWTHAEKKGYLHRDPIPRSHLSMATNWWTTGYTAACQVGSGSNWFQNSVCNRDGYSHKRSVGKWAFSRSCSGLLKSSACGPDRVSVGFDPRHGCDGMAPESLWFLFAATGFCRFVSQCLGLAHRPFVALVAATLGPDGRFLVHWGWWGGANTVGLCGYVRECNSTPFRVCVCVLSVVPDRDCGGWGWNSFQILVRQLRSCSRGWWVIRLASY
jgi:hypothetical protein